MIAPLDQPSTPQQLGSNVISGNLTEEIALHLAASKGGYKSCQSHGTWSTSVPTW